ncbi:hypothetical protein [Nocardia vinacea]|uniref:hypothetical protein n=1 Tax=Nocardia vinacea TaxID=96468 RepID=UPI0002D35168|nr:hypothetical protein [Nocardia vinacea]
MESSRAKIAGPVIAAGAVSLGLVLIGACGIGKHDTYVAPPPIKSANDDAVPAVRYGTSTSAAPKVFIPPSPSWQVARPGPPRKSVDFTVPPSALPESTTRGPQTAPSYAAPTAVPSPAFTTEIELPPNTQPRPAVDPTIEEPPTTRRVPTATSPGLSDDE